VAGAVVIPVVAAVIPVAGADSAAVETSAVAEQAEIGNLIRKLCLWRNNNLTIWLTI
jgi:hypothetical protein